MSLIALAAAAAIWSGVEAFSKVHNRYVKGQKESQLEAVLAKSDTSASIAEHLNKQTCPDLGADCSLVVNRVAKDLYGIEYAKADAWKLDRVNDTVYRTNTLPSDVLQQWTAEQRQTENNKFWAEAIPVAQPGDLVGISYRRTGYQQQANAESETNNAHTHVGMFDGEFICHWYNGTFPRDTAADLTKKQMIAIAVYRKHTHK